MLHSDVAALGRQGLPNGEGTYTFPDGARYVGQVVDGRVTGLGRYTLPSGDVS